jgi:hypothetical protein
MGFIGLRAGTGWVHIMCGSEWVGGQEEGPKPRSARRHEEDAEKRAENHRLAELRAAATRGCGATPQPQGRVGGKARHAQGPRSPKPSWRATVRRSGSACSTKR